MVHDEELAPAAPGRVMRISLDAGVGVTGGVGFGRSRRDGAQTSGQPENIRMNRDAGGHEIFSASRSSAAANVFASCKRVRSDTARKIRRSEIFPHPPEPPRQTAFRRARRVSHTRKFLRACCALARCMIHSRALHALTSRVWLQSPMSRNESRFTRGRLQWFDLREYVHANSVIRTASRSSTTSNRPQPSRILLTFTGTSLATGVAVRTTLPSRRLSRSPTVKPGTGISAVVLQRSQW